MLVNTALIKLILCDFGTYNCVGLKIYMQNNLTLIIDEQHN